MDAQQAFDRLIAAAKLPVRMQRGGGIGDTLREDRGSRTTGGGGRGNVSAQFQSDRDDRSRQMADAGNDPVATPRGGFTMTPEQQQLYRAGLKTRAGFQRFPGGKLPIDEAAGRRILDLQRQGFKFGTYQDNPELFEKLLENSGRSIKLGARGEAGDRNVGRFVYDPRTDELKGFESPAAGVGIASLLANALGKSLGDSAPMVFTGTDQFDFLSKTMPDPRDEESTFNPCPPGFVLKDGVCTPIAENLTEEPERPDGIPGFEMFAEGGIVQNLESIEDRAQEFSDFVSSKISGSGAANYMSTPSYPASQMSSPGSFGGPQAVLGTPNSLSAEDAYAKAVEDARSQRAAGFMGRVVLPGEMPFEEFKNMNFQPAPLNASLMNNPFNSLR